MLGIETINHIGKALFAFVAAIAVSFALPAQAQNTSAPRIILKKSDLIKVMTASNAYKVYKFKTVNAKESGISEIPVSKHFLQVNAGLMYNSTDKFVYHKNAPDHSVIALPVYMQAGQPETVMAEMTREYRARIFVPVDRNNPRVYEFGIPYKGGITQAKINAGIIAYLKGQGYTYNPKTGELFFNGKLVIKLDPNGNFAQQLSAAAIYPQVTNPVQPGGSGAILNPGMVSIPAFRYPAGNGVFIFPGTQFPANQGGTVIVTLPDQSKKTITFSNLNDLVNKMNTILAPYNLRYNPQTGIGPIVANGTGAAQMPGHIIFIPNVGNNNGMFFAPGGNFMFPGQTLNVPQGFGGGQIVIPSFNPNQGGTFVVQTPKGPQTITYSNLNDLIQKLGNVLRPFGYTIAPVGNNLMFVPTQSAGTFPGGFSSGTFNPGQGVIVTSGAGIHMPGVFQVSERRQDLVNPDRVYKRQTETLVVPGRGNVNGVTYTIAKVKIPYWGIWDIFGYDNTDRWVILRKGTDGGDYLITREEHAFLMQYLKAHPNEEFEKKLKKTGTYDFIASDYARVREVSMKYTKEELDKMNGQGSQVLGGTTIYRFPSGSGFHTPGSGSTGSSSTGTIFRVPGQQNAGQGAILQFTAPGTIGSGSIVNPGTGTVVNPGTGAVVTPGSGNNSGSTTVVIEAPQPLTDKWYDGTFRLPVRSSNAEGGIEYLVIDGDKAYRKGDPNKTALWVLRNGTWVIVDGADSKVVADKPQDQTKSKKVEFVAKDGKKYVLEIFGELKADGKYHWNVAGGQGPDGGAWLKATEDVVIPKELIEKAEKLSAEDLYKASQADTPRN